MTARRVGEYAVLAALFTIAVTAWAVMLAWSLARGAWGWAALDLVGVLVCWRIAAYDAGLAVEAIVAAIREDRP